MFWRTKPFQKRLNGVLNDEQVLALVGREAHVQRSFLVVDALHLKLWV